MDAVKERKVRWMICLALVVVTIAAYWRVTHCGFVDFDDDDYVTANPEVNRGLALSGVAWAFTHFYASNWHPLTWISLMLDCQLFGLNAGAFHVVNLAFHAANAVLLFLLMDRMTGAFWRSAVVAGLFALHPLHVESVAWISERKDLLSTFFGLLALLAYVRYVNESNAQAPKPKIWLACASVFFAFSLMSKPMLVTLPFVMLLLDYWPLNRISISRAVPFGTQYPKLKILLLEKWPFFGLTLVMCVVTFFAQKSGGAVLTLADHPGFRIGNALVSYLRYIEKMIWPVKLSVIYPLSPVPVWEAIAAGAILVAFSILCVVAAGRWPYLLAGWLWYLGMLVPVIGLMQVGKQAYADRYTYMPLTGLFLMVVWSAADLVNRWKFRKLAGGVGAALILLLCAAGTVFQLQFWKNGVALFGRALAVTTANATAQNGFAIALAAAGKMQEAYPHYLVAMRLEPDNPVIQNDFAAALVALGKTQEAFSHYAAAARLGPDNPVIQNNFGVALAREGRTDGAITRYRRALEIQPDYADACNNLGAALIKQKRFKEAVAELNRALTLQPNNADAHNNLGQALALQGKPAEAVVQYREAARLNPTNAAIRLNLGLALLRLGQPVEAAREFSKAAHLDPESAETQYQLGRCLAILRQPEAAVAHLRAAARRRPDWAEPLDALAWILATDGDARIRNGAEAVRLAKTAATLSHWRQPVILNTLAAAYAEAGQFENAANVAGQAIELARQSGQTNLVVQIRSTLELYQQHRAFHHP